MKFAWRALLSKAAIGCAGFGLLMASSGCQTWSPSAWGVPTGTRVQPPPTGTVKPQGAYYSNPPTGTAAAPVKATTQASANSQSAPVVQASAVSPLGSSGMPATNLSDSSGTFSSVSKAFGSQPTGLQNSSDANAYRGQVSTADYNDNGSGMAQVVSAGSLQGSGNYTSDNGLGTSSSVGDNANLQWKTAK
ncbi:MAG: hypothetical protein SFV81_21115 [Pirellulaceae bacterium]|nr:hypothetical protein [Pirellulaceae bacterium]